MSRQSDRDEFIALMTREGLPADVIRRVMRDAARLHRIAEARVLIGGDRDQVPCPRRARLHLDRETGGTVLDPCLCRDYGSWDDGTRSHGTVPRIHVQETRSQERMIAYLKPYKIVPIFSGDPRGAVVKLRVPSGRTNDWGQTGVCVP